ncbi:hypothetical protein [Facklamia sp. 7083-14-GEN3]|uniref:hypothetical protein n=1 Tax=Facklamia sp. 7083-14-GEN3 TaxID=2973478 RepID=UPI00215BC02B|nr:hypothetical protein [Facklamia sp. 7083-14-GEN3]MCR8969613.1 hypothetical protein [Facklamia sp. 7083-14-GEN3]
MKFGNVRVRVFKLIFAVLLLLNLSSIQLNVHAEEQVVSIQGTEIKLPEDYEKVREEDPLIFQKNNAFLMILISDIKESEPEIEDINDDIKNNVFEGFEESAEENNIKLFWKNTIANKDSSLNGTLYNATMYINSEENLSVFNLYFDETKSISLIVFGLEDEIEDIEEVAKEVYELNGFEVDEKLIRSEEDALKEENSYIKNSAEGKFKESDYEYAYVQDFPHGEYEIYYLFNTKEKTVTSFMTDEPTSISIAEYTGDFNNGVKFELDGLPMSGHFNYWDSPAKFVIYENGIKLDKLNPYPVGILVDMLNRYN